MLWFCVGFALGMLVGFAISFWFIVEVGLPGCRYSIDVAGHRLELAVGECDPYTRRVIATYRNAAFCFRSPTLGMVNMIARYKLDYIVRNRLDENSIK